MPIPPYQIRNVLKYYVHRLTRKCDPDRDLSETEKEDRPSSGTLPFASAEGKRKAVVARVVDDIVEKITRVKPIDKDVDKLVKSLTSRKTSPDKSGFRKDSEFEYQVMDESERISSRKVVYRLDGEKL